MLSFSDYLEVTTNWFQQSKYEINGQSYSVPQLAEWAKRNVPVKPVLISDIQRKYIGAKHLFVDDDQPNGSWTIRSMQSNLAFPILLLEVSNGMWEMIDGNHRLWKAWKTGLKSINAYIISPNKLPPPNG
jgi:hypothetical protein